MVTPAAHHYGTRIIMHVDMNAFFASVEQQANPELRGKPIAVTGAGKRTIITTASYEARAWGVKTGMNLYEARKLCPSLIFVVGDNRKYAWTSQQIIAIMRDFTPMVEVFSIDEAFLDVTGSLRLFGSPEEIACQLKERIHSEFGLTCSVGIAPNKLLAKLASDMKKPDGLTIIPSDRVLEILEGVPVKDLCGVGRKTAQQLSLYGIRTCGELGRFPVNVLQKRFGVMGERLQRMGRGEDDSPVVPEEEAEEVKSVSHSMTFGEDLSDRDEIVRRILQLSEMVGRRARRYGVCGRTVTVSIRYADFDTNEGKQETVPSPISATADIYHAAVRILDSMKLQQPVRLLGVRLSNLQHGGEQPGLFDQVDEKKGRMTEAMDAVNSRYGSFTLTFGDLADGRDKSSGVISPAWKPAGIRNVEVK